MFLGQASKSSPKKARQQSYLGSGGYMQMFSNESAREEAVSEQPAAGVTNPLDHIPPVLLESYVETFLDYGFTWCPIFDKECLNPKSDLMQSSLLKHVLAVFGTSVKPPLLEHKTPSEHYQRAKILFYTNGEENPITRIRALMLFYWWSGSPPNLVSLDSNFWWMGVCIRLAQEVGLHREPSPAVLARSQETAGLRRRIWWTLFVRRID